MLATYGYGTRGQLATGGYGADARPQSGEVALPVRRATAPTARTLTLEAQREANGVGARHARVEVLRG
jgi:hypothetical protein